MCYCNSSDFHFRNSNLLIFFEKLENISIYLVLAERFFHNKERLLATSIGVYSNYIGIGIGYLISPLIVGNHPVIFFRK